MTAVDTPQYTVEAMRAAARMALTQRILALHKTVFVSLAFRDLTTLFADHATTHVHASEILDLRWPGRSAALVARLQRRGLPSPKAMLSSMRLWQAIFLLRAVQPVPRTADVATAMHWCTPQKLNAAFKKRYRMTLKAGVQVADVDMFWSDVVRVLDPGNPVWHAFTL